MKKTDPLPKTLSQRVQYLRELKFLSLQELADLSYIKQETLEAIESGIDTFLSINTRQKLAKALKVTPRILQEVEKGNDKIPSISADTVDFMKESILSGRPHNLYCPRCGAELITSIAIFEDLQGHAVQHPKARCCQCVFQIT